MPRLFGRDPQASPMLTCLVPEHPYPYAVALAFEGVGQFDLE